MAHVQRPLALSSPRLALPSRWLGSFVTAVVAWVMIGAAPMQAAGQESGETWQPPAPEDVVLKTNDDVSITATYYAGVADKDTVPVILLHGFKGSRHDVNDLALFLQSLGWCSVIAPDLRGHGDSNKLVNPIKGRLEKVEPGALKNTDLAGMVSDDMEAVKHFLMAKHRNKELNIDRLCVIGADMGSSVALNWTLLDWKGWGPLLKGKQGQDVKAVVLISPEWNSKGLLISEAVNDDAVRSQVSMLIIAGRKNGKSLADAQRLYDSVKKFHPTAGDATAVEGQDLFFVKADNRLRGAELLNEKTAGLYPQIAKFIELRCRTPNIPWEDRRLLKLDKK